MAVLKHYLNTSAVRTGLRQKIDYINYIKKTKQNTRGICSVFENIARKMLAFANCCFWFTSVQK